MDFGAYASILLYSNRETFVATFKDREYAAPGQPPANIATAVNKLEHPGKYGVGTLAPPIGFPASSNSKSGYKS